MIRWLKSFFFGTVTNQPYIGAIHGHRFSVVKRPSDTYVYGGNAGAKAREAYESTHPGHGETVELWDRDVCRGRK